MKFQAIRDLRNNLSKVDTEKAAKNALKARSYDIAELNREQLQQGKTASGATLPPYSKTSVAKFGKPAGAIKLYDTGDFYKGITPEFAKADFQLKDSDAKTDMLQDRYGDDILGLTEESISELAQDSLGQIQYEIRNQL